MPADAERHQVHAAQEEAASTGSLAAALRDPSPRQRPSCRRPGRSKLPAPASRLLHPGSYHGVIASTDRSLGAGTAWAFWFLSSASSHWARVHPPTDMSPPYWLEAGTLPRLCRSFFRAHSMMMMAVASAQAKRTTSSCHGPVFKARSVPNHMSNNSSPSVCWRSCRCPLT